MGHNVNILPNIRARRRGAAGVPKSRFDIQTRDWFDDGWDIEEEAPVFVDTCLFMSKLLAARRSLPELRDFVTFLVGFYMRVFLNSPQEVRSVKYQVF